MIGPLTLMHLDAIERQCLLVQNNGHHTDAWLLTAILKAARQHLRDKAKKERSEERK
jgi:hypothetical protein